MCKPAEPLQTAPGRAFVPGVIIDGHEAAQNLSAINQLRLVNVINAALPTRHIFNIGHFALGDSLAVTCIKVAAYIVRMIVEWCVLMPLVMTFITVCVVPTILITALPTLVTCYDNWRKSKNSSHQGPDRTAYVRYFNLANLFRAIPVNLDEHNIQQNLLLEQRVNNLEDDQNNFGNVQNSQTKVNIANALLPSRHIFGCKLFKAGEGRCMRACKIALYVLLFIAEWTLFLPTFLAFASFISLFIPFIAIPTLVTKWDNWRGNDITERTCYVQYCSWQNISAPLTSA